jgi:hypothetical protein
MSDVVNGADAPIAEPVLSDLEQLILAEIEAIRSDVVATLQQGEVAEKFFREALSLERAGKRELAERKVKAAMCVKTGRYEE